MPKEVALFVFVLLILWLFVRDREVRPMTSLALWIPLLWFLIVSSKPISFWFMGPTSPLSSDARAEGNLLEASMYFALMILGLSVLFSRGLAWRRIFASNWWLYAFLLYCGISVIWSDYPFVSFKRWFKDLGNVVMVLIVLSETNSFLATRALLARFTYLVIPVSILLMKYYTDLGKYFKHYGGNFYSGIATEKNGLGCIALISGLFLLWDFVHMRCHEKTKLNLPEMLSRLMLVVMILWILYKAESSTATVCLAIGACVILILQLPFARIHIQYLGTYVVVLGLLVLLLFPLLAQEVSRASELFLGVLGEDISLTGRTVLWGQLLSEPINPFLGTGHQSFWMGDRARRYWEMWSFHPNQAHNGYIETYLNGGLVGVSLLIATIVTCGGRLKAEITRGSSYGILCFTLSLVAILYNVTEAEFSKMSPLWVLFLMACLSHLRSSTGVGEHCLDRN